MQCCMCKYEWSINQKQFSISARPRWCSAWRRSLQPRFKSYWTRSALGTTCSEHTLQNSAWLDHTVRGPTEKNPGLSCEDEEVFLQHTLHTWIFLLIIFLWMDLDILKVAVVRQNGVMCAVNTVCQNKRSLLSHSTAQTVVGETTEQQGSFWSSHSEFQ